MSDQFKEFIKVLKALYENDVEYILIGGVALILHGMERLTRDVDLFIKMTPENIHNLRNALKFIYEDDSIDEITFDELKKYQVIRYGTPDGFYIDLMAKIGTAFSYEDISYKIIDYEEIKIKIATPETLFKLKNIQSAKRTHGTLVF